MSKVSYYDVSVPVWIADTNIKYPSLKWASLHYLGIEQLHFDEVIEDAGSFFYLNPSDNQDTVFYAAADALCTFLLATNTVKYFQEGGWSAKFDNMMLYPLLHYENEKIWIDGNVLKEYYKIATDRVDKLERDVYDMIGNQINLNSPIQVSQAFERLGIDTGQRTDSGAMAVGIKVLADLPKEYVDNYPALRSYIEYKKTAKLISSYIKPFLKEYDRRGYCRFAYKTTEVPTGRLACGKDGKNSFFSPINAQSIPKPHVKMEDVFDLGDRNLFSKKDNIIMGYKFVYSSYDENGKHIIPDDSRYIGWVEGMDDDLNIRMSISPKLLQDDGDDDFLYCSFDYAAEELRIAANLSREPNWVKAFTSGDDIHKSTAVAIWGEEHYNRDYRKMAKYANFSILYGASSHSLYADSRYGFKSLQEAEDFYNKYKKALPVLFQWQDRIIASAKRKGMIQTYFGRPRRLRSYYENRQIGFANRSAGNTSVQGVAGDILKMVMIKLWKALFNNDEYKNDVGWRVAIHDEIGYSIRATKLMEIMKLIKETQSVKLKDWPVEIMTDPSVGWSMGRVYDFHIVEDDTELGYHFEPDLA